MALNFAPYQAAAPETHRAMSPPPARRTQSPRRSFSPSSGARATAPTNPSAYTRIASPPPPPPLAGPSRGYTDHEAGDEDRRSSAWNAWTNDAGVGGDGAGFGGGSAGGGYLGARAEVSEFETSLPLRLDYEACLAYLLLPPAGGVLLLVLEWKSDYVRFHAWQSSLLFSAMFVLHLILSWSSWLSYLLLIGDLAMIGYLTMRTYRDAETLDRCEVPFFGALASRFVDDE